MFATFHSTGTIPSCSDMLNTCASGLLICSTVSFSNNYVFGERLCAYPLYQLETLYNMKQLVDVPTRETLNIS